LNGKPHADNVQAGGSQVNPAVQYVKCANRVVVQMRLVVPIALHVELQNSATFRQQKEHANNAKPGNTKTKKNKLIVNIVPMAIMANTMFPNARTMVGKNRMIAMRVVSSLMIPLSILKIGLVFSVRPALFVKNIQPSKIFTVLRQTNNIGECRTNMELKVWNYAKCF
jgi:hypothetical protein